MRELLLILRFWLDREMVLDLASSFLMKSLLEFSDLLRALRLFWRWWIFGELFSLGLRNWSFLEDPFGFWASYWDATLSCRLSYFLAFSFCFAFLDSTSSLSYLKDCDLMEESWSYAPLVWPSISKMSFKFYSWFSLVFWGSLISWTNPLLSIFIWIILENFLSFLLICFMFFMFSLWDWIMFDFSFWLVIWPCRSIWRIWLSTLEDRKL